MAHTLEFLDDPETFLAATGDHLAATAVQATVVATVAERIRREVEEGLPAPSGFPVWWLVVRDADGSVVGAGMRVAPFEPHPAYLLAMPDEAARELARERHRQGDVVRGVNGALPAVEVFAAETARLAGGSVRVAEHTRLFELADLREPPAPAGGLRLAREDEADQAVAWYHAFGVDAARQAGRHTSHAGAELDREDVVRRVREGQVWFWVDGAGTPVHVTGVSAPVFGVARVGPVYTPQGHRGRGYAAAAVAGVSRRLLDSGARVCLFTDQANPVSNRLYERLGYEPVVDMANLVIEPT